MRNKQRHKNESGKSMLALPRGLGFPFSLLVVCGLAWASPSLGMREGPFLPEITSLIAVFVIFLVQGWNLDLRRLRAASSRKSVALSLHPFIFLVPPMLVLLAYALGLAPAGWSQAILFLAILPTTISSCVVYTRLAGGDADEALGHATFSNMLAVVWVPVAWGAFLSSDGESVGVTQSMGLFLGDLLVLMILPCLVGWWARKKLENRLGPLQGKCMQLVPFGCILVLAYFSFCPLFGDRFIQDLRSEAVGLAAFICGFLVLLTLLAWFAGRAVSSRPETRLAFFFCAGQKSLAVGLPMAHLLVGPDHSAVGELVLPLVLFHFGQLLLGSLLLGILGGGRSAR